MISLDIESSGLDSGKCGIWQIGAVEIENPENQFLEEAKIDNEDEITQEALTITGKTEVDLRNKEKQSQKQLILNFLEWAKNCKNKIIIGHNIGWDMAFIQNKCIRYKIMDKFREAIGHRSFDTHTIAQIKYKEKNNEYLIKEEGKSGMNLSKMLNFCELKDDRIQMKAGEVIKKGKPHNALEDDKLTAECFKKLMEINKKWQWDQSELKRL